MGYKLWIARKIMRLHRGELTVNKLDDDGLSIVLSLPLLTGREALWSFQSEVPSSHPSNVPVPSLRKFLPFGHSPVVPLPSVPGFRSNQVNQMSIIEEQSMEHETECALPPPIVNDGTNGTRVSSGTCRSEKVAHYRVLVVDDSAMIRKMVMKLMGRYSDTITLFHHVLLNKIATSLGHTCEEVDDGDMAVQKITSNPNIDIILMDNQMPRMTGAIATEIIRNDLNYKGIILGVTGNALPEDIKDFIEKGADDVIVKPLNTKGFIDAVGRILRERDSSMQHE